ncbi:unnamed protein product [Lupinus luteus]|uniref:Uncharacterized protein n=1 Tax=Lupinus luteus TaxID=3873 RepID=A0AAV1WL13_LUPLU
MVENKLSSMSYNILDKVTSMPELYDLHYLSPITTSLECSEEVSTPTNLVNANWPNQKHWVSNSGYPG